MEDFRIKPWMVGAVIVLGLRGYFWWKGNNPTLMDGDYWCEGRTSHPDGTNSAIDGMAGVSAGKIQVGQTGADIAMGKQVMHWGEVQKTSRTEFLVELTPSTEIRDEISRSFWLTCQHR